MQFFSESRGKFFFSVADRLAYSLGKGLNHQNLRKEVKFKFFGKVASHKADKCVDRPWIYPVFYDL